jgi:uncharacterized DUF497 family protein
MPVAASRDRPRYKAVDFLGRDLVVLIFSPLGTEAIAPISLRPASRKEALGYAAFIESLD